MKLVRILVVAACWLPLITAGGIPPAPAVLAGLAAVLVVPGWLLRRRLGRPSTASAAWIAAPAESLAMSLFVIAVLELGCAALGLGMTALLVGLASASAFLALLEPRNAETAPLEPTDATTAGDGIATTVFVSVALLTVALAWAGENVARDRMWYSAWVSNLASSASFGWNDPFFGTGYVPARFTHNAWLTGLGALSRLTDIEAPTLFDRTLPVFLTVCAASAAWALANALFGGGARASLAALAQLAVLLGTRYPFFSPERYPFFGRLAEDKFTALVVLFPIALAAAWRLLGGFTLARAVTLLAACTAVAFSHALVQLVLIVTLTPFCLWRALTDGDRRNTAIAVVAILVLTSIGPGVAAWTARGQIVESPEPSQILAHDARHPVVRSHLRMQRLTDLPRGGPIVDPRLLGEPLFALALVGLIVAWLRRREAWARLLLYATCAHLLLAFAPFVSPYFGKLIVPWMTYRALWGVPFGALLGLVAIEAALATAAMTGARAVSVALVALIVTASIAANLPWDRLEHDPTAQRERLDPGTRALLDELRQLAPESRVAAARGLAELIPAHTGRYVLATSDRATVVFTGSRRQAERRLIGNAVLLGLDGGSTRLRNRVVSDFDVTHTIYEQRDCDRAAAEIFRNERYTLCAERYRSGRRFRVRRTTAVAAAAPTGALRAALNDLLQCRPAPQWIEKTRVNHWSRATRWNARPVVVECATIFPRATAVRRLRLALNLPKAREAVVYRVHVEMFDGSDYTRQGVLEFRENPYGELALPPGMVRSITVRLVPAFLPYLNVRALDLRS
jgi:hypothetical protein